MGTDAGFVAFLLEQLGPHRALSGPLHARRMFGEYALYADARVVALLCDDEIYLKPLEAARAVLGTAGEGFPYPGAKAHLVATAWLDEPEVLARAIGAVAAELPAPGAKRPKRR